MAESVPTFSPSPGNKTFGELKSEVARYVGMPDSPEGLVIAGDGLTDAIRQLNMNVWDFTLAKFDVDLAANQYVYDGPADFHKPRHAVFLDATSGIMGTCGWQDPKEFQAAEVSHSSSSNPNYYTVYNSSIDGQLELDNAPDSQFVTDNPTLRLRYYRYIAYPVNQDDVISVPAQVESFITWHAKSYIASIFAPDKQGPADTRAQRAWKALIKDSRRSSDWS